ncbi:Lrp/AsnC family transcriptional regulator [Desulforamulus ruminis]|uniref:siroheme decarboxylase subunit beta n=1 Tax=Desulforamulus ruminis TaxID=1564 RepID=UPI002352F6BC|nr:Lrp/AsnC family transcriptional regulator [Desulforamulus ruminis]
MTDLEKKLIRHLQSGLPLVPRPFAELASQFDLNEAEVLAKVNDFKKKGYLKRISPVLSHQRVGYLANALVVWRVPPESIEEVGQKLARQPAVSHCYQRKVQTHWPYNLYTMIHAQTGRGLYSVIKTMSDSVQVNDYLILVSTRELKKSSMQYFFND